MAAAAAAAATATAPALAAADSPPLLSNITAAVSFCLNDRTNNNYNLFQLKRSITTMWPQLRSQLCFLCGKISLQTTKVAEVVF